MIRTIIIVISVWLFTYLGLHLGLPIYIEHTFHPIIGGVYSHDLDDDPFTEPYSKQIIEVKDGYYKYVISGYCATDTIHQFSDDLVGLWLFYDYVRTDSLNKYCKK